MEIGTLNQRIAFLEHSTKVDGIGNSCYFKTSSRRQPVQLSCNIS